MTAQILTYQQNTPEWLEARRKYMGSSDAAAALGLSSWRKPTEVAADKRTPRTSDSHPEPETDQQKRGHTLEPVVCHLYSERTGRKLAGPAMMVSEANPFMAASIDSLLYVTDDLNDIEKDKTRHLEAKTHIPWVMAEYGPDGSGEVSTYEFVQCQHQMAVYGSDVVDVAILIGEEQSLQLLAHMVDGGTSIERAADLAKQLLEFRVYHVERDEEFIKDLIEQERDFWTRYVEGDEVPVDFTAITPRKTIRLATPQEAEMIAMLKEAYLTKERAGRTSEDIKARLQNAIGEDAGIQCEHGKVTWNRSKDTTNIVTDYKTALIQHLEADGNSIEEIKLYLDSFTSEQVTRYGSRRFLTDRAWSKEL